jgi:phosphatidylcholine synthase
VLLLLAVLVFVPVRYVYPSRTPVLRSLTIALGAVWGALMLTVLWQMPGASRVLFWLSLVFPVYYVALSRWRRPVAVAPVRTWSKALALLDQTV